jgi:hypothetical protein
VPWACANIRILLLKTPLWNVESVSRVSLRKCQDSWNIQAAIPLCSELRFINTVSQSPCLSLSHSDINSLLCPVLDIWNNVADYRLPASRPSPARRLPALHWHVRFGGIQTWSDFTEGQSEGLERAMYITGRRNDVMTSRRVSACPSSVLKFSTCQEDKYYQRLSTETSTSGPRNIQTSYPHLRPIKRQATKPLLSPTTAWRLPMHRRRKEVAQPVTAVPCIRETLLSNLVWLDKNKQKNSMVWVRERTIPTERRRLSAKWLPTFAARECHLVSVTDPYGCILDFLDRSRYFSIK